METRQFITSKILDESQFHTTAFINAMYEKRDLIFSRMRKDIYTYDEACYMFKAVLDTAKEKAGD